MRNFAKSRGDANLIRQMYEWVSANPLAKKMNPVPTGDLAEIVLRFK